MTNQPIPLNETLRATHPLLTKLLVAMNRGEKFQVVVDEDDDSFGLDGYRISILRTGDCSPIATFPWDAEVNEELISLGVRSKHSDSESIRFAIRLRDELRATETRYGNGFFNRTLVDLVTESYLDKHQEIKAALEKHRGITLERTSEYHECRDSIAYVIGKRSRELTGPLGYEEATMRNILSKAIARFLDNRFSLSQRKQMGMI